MFSSTNTKRRNETAQIRKEMWDEMNNHDISEGGSDLFKRAKAQELGQRRMVQTSFVSSFPSAGGAAELTGTYSNEDGSYAASAAAKKNPFATVSLISETKAPMATSPSSSLDLQIDDTSMKRVKDAQSLLKAIDQGLMSIFCDPFSPAIIPTPSTKWAGTSASETKSIAPVQATSAFTGFTFQTSSNINYRDTTKQAPQVNSSSSSNQGFTFFPTASTSSKTNSETKALGSIKLDYQQFGLDSSLFKVKQLAILAQTVAVEDVAKNSLSKVRWNATFSLIKAIVSRRFLSAEFYDLMEKLLELDDSATRVSY